MTDFISRLRNLSSSRGSAKSSGSSLRVPRSRIPQSDQQSSSSLTVRERRRQRRQSRPPQVRRPLYERWRFWVILLLGVGVTGAVTQGYRFWQKTEAELPESSEVLTYARNGTLTIKAADGAILQQIGPATRENVPIDKMPPQLVRAFLASEDRRFYKHSGIDYQAILRAIRANLQEREVVEGASTITQQLARIVFLDQDRTLHRKFREALLARKMEQELSKDEILERYLNLVYLGSGAYGVGDAAWIYFSKPIDQLTLPEMAMIAGMAPAPSVYSPLVEPEAALQRRNIVLQRMQEDGVISQAEAEAAIASPLEVKPSTPKYLYSATPYFTSYVQQQLKEILSSEELERGGLTVETTLNPQWQKAAEETVQQAIERWGPGQRFEQAALVAIDPRNGEIKALVGGDDFNKSQFNRATQAQRQPGSTFKTFVYTTAIAAGFSPYKSYVDAKYVVDGYEPKNYGDGYSGSVTLRNALMSSINIVAVKVLVDVGFDPVIDMAQAMGIKSELLPAYSLALGASEVNLLELTNAYGALAAEGMHHEAHAIRRIYDRYGDLVYNAADLKPERAVDAETAAIMTWMLRGVVQGGTGSRAALDRQVAGKTGTSERNRDLWFVGYIPQLVAGVWLGNDDSSPTWGVSSTAAATWRRFMVQIIDEIPAEEFPELPRLEGREGTIKAEPVKPGRVRADRASSSRGENEASDRGYSERRRRDSDDYQEYDSGGSDYSGNDYRESDNSGSESSGSSRSRRSDSAPEKTPPADNEPKSPPPVESEDTAPPPPAPEPPPAPAPPEPPPAPAAPEPAPAAPPAASVKPISPGPEPVPLPAAPAPEPPPPPAE